VGEVGAGGVAEGVAAAAIALLEHRLGVARLLGGKAQFAADALVDVFGQRLGHLDREAVLVEGILVAVLGETFARRLRGAPSHRHDLQPDAAAPAVIGVAEEVGDAEAALLVLARERKAGQLALAVAVEDNDVIALGGAGPIAVDGLGDEDVLADRYVEDAAQHRAQFVLRPLAVFGEALAVL